MTDPAAASHLTCGIAVRAASGETRCGDRAVVTGSPELAVVAVIDGLGHGPDAADAADRAADVLAQSELRTPPDLLDQCHAALHRTRGAAISLATVTRTGHLQWSGVGNVAGRILHTGPRRSTGLVARAGIVGHRLPRLRAETVELDDGDLLVLFTDGLDPTTARDVAHRKAPQPLADTLLQQHARGTDDALILTAQYRARPT